MALSTRSKTKKRNLPEQSGSSGNLEFGNSKPGIPEEMFDKAANENASKKKNLSKRAVIPLSIVESRFRDLVSGKIDKGVCQMIANHCSEKLREILQVPKDYMTSCGRLSFTVDDFNKGLLFYDEYPAVCCESLQPQEKKTNNKLEESTDPQHVSIDEIWLNEITPFSDSIEDLPDEQQEYFKALVDVLSYNIEEARTMFIDDLKTNRNITQLVPHLVSFFCELMRECKCDFLKMSMLFQFLDAILRNGHLYFGQDSYLNVLTHALLEFLVADLPNSDQFIDCWTLKDTAANVLTFIIYNRSRDQLLFFEVLYFLRSAFSFRNSIKSHYGALAALNCIGAPALYLLLPSYIRKFHKYAQTILARAQNRSDFNMMQGQIVCSYHLLVDFYFKYSVRKPKFNLWYHVNSKFFAPNYLKGIEVLSIISQPFFSDYFGEALLPNFPLLNFVSHSPYLRKNKRRVLKKAKNCVLKSLPQLLQINM